MQMRQQVDSGITQWVVPLAQPAIFNDTSNGKHTNKTVDKTTGFMTGSTSWDPPVGEHKTIGTSEVLNKRGVGQFDNDSLEPLIPLGIIPAALALDNARLNQSILEGYMHTVKVLAATIDAKDPYTHGHSQRVK